MASPTTPDTPACPKTMKAWIHISTGSLSQVVAPSHSVQTPNPATSSEVLIKISHAALNPGGSIMMQILPMIFRPKPSIPEVDFAGTVFQVGSDVSESRNLKVGTDVFGSVPVGAHIRGGKGALAESVGVEAENVCLKPENMAAEEAAGLPVAGYTALALIDAAKLKDGIKVLINGASGGIESMVVQMARAAVGESGKIVAICSNANVEMVKGLGANEVVDYQALTPVHKFLTTRFETDQFDVIIDAFGVQSIFHNSESSLNPGKPYISVGPAMSTYSVAAIFYSIGQMASNFLWPRWLGAPNRPYVQVAAAVTLGRMQRLADLVRDGKLRVPIDSCWEMEDGLKAYERILSRRAKGKVVVNI